MRKEGGAHPLAQFYERSKGQRFGAAQKGLSRLRGKILEPMKELCAGGNLIGSVLDIWLTIEAN